MPRLVVLDVVGLTPRLLDHMPGLAAFARAGGQRSLQAVTPALTCVSQSTYLTGALPREHGIVGNGWYQRDIAEIRLWSQSGRLVAGEKVWEAARRIDAEATCATLFWWHGMYTSADWSVTPLPPRPADGRELPGMYTQPDGLRNELDHLLGTCPFSHLWGPAADLRSTRWILGCARHVYDTRRPGLMLVYVPHLGFPLQRLGPDHPDLPKHLAQVDALCSSLIEHVREDGAEVVVLSEYGVTAVTDAVLINRALREAKLLQVRVEQGRELLDAGVSDAFAVCDHQIAHVYVQRPELVGPVQRLVAGLDGVEAVWGADRKRAAGLDHERSGELVAIARPDRWFAYYHWLDPERAPVFARTVAMHRKPGHDPLEAFWDPALTVPQLRAGWRRLQRQVGMRAPLDVIPLDPSLVRGSHGRPCDDPARGPVLLSSRADLLPDGPVPAAGVKQVMLDHVFG